MKDLIKGQKNKYLGIYQNRVVPKKAGKSANTKENFDYSLDLMEDFKIFRERANEAVLGGRSVRVKRKK